MLYSYPAVLMRGRTPKTLFLFNMKNYFYVIPNWQNEPLCIIYADNKGLKQAKKEFPNCNFEPCPFTESDKQAYQVQIF